MSDYTPVAVVPTEAPAKDTTTLITESAVEIAVKRLNNHFTLDGGLWKIDPENPPSLEQSYLIASDVMGMKTASTYLENETSWLLGNVICECRDLYGDDFEMDAIEGVSDKAYNTLITTEGVYLAFLDKRVPGISFTHHKEVLYTKHLTDDQKIAILYKARDLELTAKETRKLASIVAKEGAEILHLEPMEIVNQIDQNTKEKQPEYLLISFDDQLRKMKELDVTENIASRTRMIIKLTPDLEIVKDVQEKESNK